jgi:hypothetical protein
MPAGIFAQLRMPALRNPNPVLITPEVSLATSRQIKDYVLCNECEQRFSSTGESWVLANMARTDGFPLQELLLNARPMTANEDFAIFSGATIPDVKMDSLVYFAMSIFWRAAVHKWRTVSRPIGIIDLGAYQEPIRLFLLGADFPSNVVILVSVWPNQEVPLMAYTPRKGDALGYEAFNFLIPGIEFRLLLGERIPDQLRAICSQQSANRCIVSSSTLIGETRETFIKLASTSKVSKGLNSQWR